MLIAKAQMIKNNLKLMHKFLLLALIAAIFTSCSSSKKDNPTPSKADSAKTAQYLVKLDIASQVAYTGVSNDTLYLLYNETADLIINKAEYESSSAVHFKEDFSKSSLAGFHFTTINQNGDTANDFVDDNLNNVELDKASTIVVDGKTMVKLHLERIFLFYKPYKLQKLAVEAQNNFLKTNKDVITFSSYIYDKKDYDKTTVTVGLSYQKAD